MTLESQCRNFSAKYPSGSEVFAEVGGKVQRVRIESVASADYLPYPGKPAVFVRLDDYRAVVLLEAVRS